MSESTQTPPSSRKKKLLIAAIGVAAVCVMTAGTVVGINASNSKTEQLCTEAVTSSQNTAKAVETSIENAAKARTQADEPEGYSQHDGTADLLKAMDTAEADLSEIDLPGACETRDAAESVQDNSGAAKTQVAKLDAATEKLIDDVTAFQAETKRVAAERAAAEVAAKAEETKKAEEAKTTEAAAADQAAAEQAAAAPAPIAQPQYNGGSSYAPAPKVPSNNAPAPVAPAPAPYMPAPAPVTAGGGTGGWTPPPAGAGGNTSGCVQVGSVVSCTGG